MAAVLISLLLILLVVAVITSPWRRAVGAAPHPVDDRVRAAATVVEDLEAARDAKYREIRDAELDRQTGKLSDADFTAVDAGLRAEAIEILKELDRSQSRLDKLRRRADESSQEPADAVASASELEVEAAVETHTERS